MKVLTLGATGLVGRNALAQALARQAVTQVIAGMYSWREVTIALKILDEVTSWIVGNRKLGTSNENGHQAFADSRFDRAARSIEFKQLQFIT